MGCASSSSKLARLPTESSTMDLQSEQEGSQILRVELYSCTVREGSKYRGPNTYVVFTVPKHAHIPDQVVRSTAKPGVTPSWTPFESFSFNIADRKIARLIISVYDRGSTDPAGDALIRLSNPRHTSDDQQPLTLTLMNSHGAATKLSVQVRVEVTDTHTYSSHKTYKIWEYQRHSPFGWGSEFPKHLLPTDPGSWATYDNKIFKSKFENVAPSLQAGWRISTPWSIMSHEHDSGGWEYAMQFNSKSWSREHHARFVVRRRLWWCNLSNTGNDTDPNPNMNSYSRLDINSVKDVEDMKQPSSPRVA